MKIFAIGDLHFSGEPPTKPMDVFGAHWQDHRQRIITTWHEQVSPEDIVFVVGDISWALKLSEAIPDLQTIAALPGQIYLIRGNHDYWWSSANKMNNAMNHSLTFLQGHSIIADTLAFGGTRGYICPRDTAFNEATDTSIYARELLRTEAALQEMGDATTRILLLHYPPFNDKNEASGFTDLLAKYHVDHCIFGHLHDKTSFERIPSHFGNTQLHLVSADFMNFKLKQII